MPHEELTPRSDSLSTECSTSPPDPPGSNHSETSSGVHSNASSQDKPSQDNANVINGETIVFHGNPIYQTQNNKNDGNYYQLQHLQGENQNVNNATESYQQQVCFRLL